MRLSRTTPLLLLLILQQAFGESPTAAFTVDVRPAWAGFIRPGQVTEIRAVLVAEDGGDVELWLHASGGTVRSAVALEPGVGRELTLPVVHDGESALEVELRRAGEVVYREPLWLHTLPPAARLRVWASSDPGAAAPQLPSARAGEKLVQTGVDALPVSEHAYAPLDSLVLDATLWKHMSAEQQRALRGYAATCGSIYLVQPSPELIRVLDSLVRCGGAVLSRGADPGVLPNRRDNALQTPVSPATMRALLSESSAADGAWQAIVVFLGGYVVSLLIAARAGVGTVVLLCVPLVAAALLLLAWQPERSSSRAVSSFEVVSGQDLASHSTLVLVQGAGRGRARLRYTASLGLPRIAATTPAEVAWPAAGGQRVELSLPTTLFATSELLFRGTSALEAPLGLSIVDGAPIVANPARIPSPPAILAWQGERYTVPVLAADAHWTPGAAPEPWGATAHEQLLRGRNASAEAVVMLPIEPPFELSSPVASSDGWLLILPSSSDAAAERGS